MAAKQYQDDTVWKNKAFQYNKLLRVKIESGFQAFSLPRYVSSSQGVEHFFKMHFPEMGNKFLIIVFFAMSGKIVIGKV
jgi:uncharacterized membrane protein